MATQAKSANPLAFIEQRITDIRDCGLRNSFLAGGEFALSCLLRDLKRGYASHVVQPSKAKRKAGNA